jgi:hypothetical protein
MSATKGGILHEQGMRVLPKNPESLPFYQAPEEAASGEAAKAEILELLKSRNKSYGSRNRARPTRRRQLRKLQSGNGWYAAKRRDIERTIRHLLLCVRRVHR